jgi:drug/metabolite transporter (DMT)-like permease
MKYLLAVLAIAIGAAAIVYGEGDDSPGLQGIGGVLVIGALVFCVRTARRSR